MDYTHLLQSPHSYQPRGLIPKLGMMGNPTHSTDLLAIRANPPNDGDHPKTHAIDSKVVGHPQIHGNVAHATAVNVVTTPTSSPQSDQPVKPDSNVVDEVGILFTPSITSLTIQQYPVINYPESSIRGTLRREM